ncbi:RNA pyrophosphohydrolase [Paenibacillus solanacearum]|uniref:RNA pyrophosphohydrolase n=1 Tax=Paenibacillus solanacearum TaxID=2048548 RepID=A0A916K888_9BACL|nr:NUDIX hydrolase [Paenibacillus solanacearum]CAG7652746.1 RNA pyrophosphohydrolase [Paenibacillus solanacearum]
MISQGIIIKDNKVLMVRQYVERGDIVWNFPGGGINNNESPEEACIRELKEETGYEVMIEKLINKTGEKYTYKAKIIGGELELNKENPDNDDLIDIDWVSLEDETRFDKITKPIIEIIKCNKW